MPKIVDERHLLELRKQNKLLQTPSSEFKLTGLTLTHIKSRKKKTIFISIISIVLLFFSLIFWYFLNLQPVDSNSNEAIIFDIKSGSTQNQIVINLKNQGLIRNTFVFDIYTQLSGTKNKLKAGKYKIFKHDSTPEIVSKIASGNAAELSIMFLPGSNLMENKKNVLLKNGFSSDEIDMAYSYQYNHSLINIKPKENDIEGFIYGDTYNFSADSSLTTILSRTFDEMQKVIEKYNLESKYKLQGLSLYEGIILASIIQKEILSPKGLDPSLDQKTVAGIFYNRLRNGMTLGSDVTYQYIADKLGIRRDPKLDNIYNTRIYGGLPPGPVSSPGLTALLAAAEPAVTRYYYFLSGDDGKTYYAQNSSEHQQNIIKYCQKLCANP